VKLIGLHGKAGSGKDTAARALAQCGWAKLALADPLRELLVYMNPTIVGRFHRGYLADLVDKHGWDKLKREEPAVRDLMQRTGEAGRRAFGQDFWIRQASMRLNRETRNVIVTDVRYPNEAEWIRESGGIVVRIFWPDSPHGLTGSAADHVTENVLQCDVDIENKTGKPERLARQIKLVAKKMDDNPTPHQIWGHLTEDIRKEWTPTQEETARVCSHSPFSLPTATDPD